MTEDISIVPDIVLLIRVDKCLCDLYTDLTANPAQTGSREILWDPTHHSHSTISDLPVLEYLFHECGGGISSAASDRDNSVTMQSADCTEHNPIPLVEIKDSYDESTFDNMCGVVQMRFVLPDAKAFPSKWKIHRSHTKVFVEYVPLDPNSHGQGNIHHRHLIEWIENICKCEKKV
jgi:hypothetical protein